MKRKPTNAIEQTPQFLIDHGSIKDVKLSIIIPVYNGEKFIRACLDKVLQIDLTKEIIVINDGSTDYSLQRLEAYGNQIILINLKENKGVSNARNLGLERATGDYIAFIDVDDDFELDMHAKILTKMMQDGSDVGMCDYDMIQLNGKVRASKYPVNFGDLDQSEVIALFLRDKLADAIWTSVYRASLAKQTQFGEEIRIGEDLLYQLRILLNAKKTSFVNETLYHYVQHPTSTMHSITLSNGLLERTKVPEYLTNEENEMLNHLFHEEFEYFKLVLIQKCAHTISAEARQNKKAAKRLLQSLLSKDICRAVVKNQYFPKCIKVEFWILKTFGVSFHLFMFPLYQLMRRIFMPKGIKW